ncbi:MAG TPA: LPS export ABC transporter permease LptF [Terriglobia bacterium]|nr:LPS export ABC transporter permease LptF [Terriglobia bacterium]
MRILSRYIFKEIFFHSLLGLLIFTFVIFIPHISYLLEILVRHNISIEDISILFMLPIPRIVVLTIPMAVLVGTLIGLSRMAADGEVIAVRASGIGLGQFVRPVMVFAVLGWAATSWMSLSLAPRAGRKLNQMEEGLKSSQAPYEIQPRVFLEQFPNLLIYLEDVSGSHSKWTGVFIADSTHGDPPKITLAERGLLVSDPASNRLMLHLEQGTTHEIDPQSPGRYSVVSFSDTDIPIPLEPSSAATLDRQTPPTMSLHRLTEMARASANATLRQNALVELHYRFALPVASLVLALVGIPLGLFTRKGGKASGVMLTILLVFIYYILMAFGRSLALQGRIPPAIGLWLANAVFALGGSLMLTNLRRFRMRLHFIQDWLMDLAKRWESHQQTSGKRMAPLAILNPQSSRRLFQILDGYIIRSWLFYFFALIVTFIGIYMIFDFFQLLGDIVHNHIAPLVVANYYIYLIPQIIYLMLPWSTLVATQVNFGILTKTNQVTAIKATGTSLYRLAVPILLAATVASAGMFIMEDNYLPQTNQRQDALRNQIKGKPAQTYLRPDRQWIFGQGERIYNYRFFDADHDVFANLSVFELDPKTFKLTRRIYAQRAFWETNLHRWVLEQGWVRDLDGDRVAKFTPFAVSTFDEFTEEPPYFKKEVKPSAQMSAFELRRYISELSRSGFDVVRLSVQFYRKFSFPLMAFVVVLIGIPFSFTTGSKGALSGIALSIGIAIVYFSTAGLFEAMGNLSQLPPVVAAWSPDVLFGLGGMYLLLRVRT